MLRVQATGYCAIDSASIPHICITRKVLDLGEIYSLSSSSGVELIEG
jgi:hypothetical protein